MGSPYPTSNTKLQTSSNATFDYVRTTPDPNANITEFKGFASAPGVSTLPAPGNYIYNITVRFDFSGSLITSGTNAPVITPTPEASFPNVLDPGTTNNQARSNRVLIKYNFNGTELTVSSSTSDATNVEKTSSSDTFKFTSFAVGGSATVPNGTVWVYIRLTYNVLGLPTISMWDIWKPVVQPTNSQILQNLQAYVKNDTGATGIYTYPTYNNNILPTIANQNGLKYTIDGWCSKMSTSPNDTLLTQQFIFKWVQNYNYLGTLQTNGITTTRITDSSLWPTRFIPNNTKAQRELRFITAISTIQYNGGDVNVNQDWICNVAGEAIANSQGYTYIHAVGEGMSNTLVVIDGVLDSLGNWTGQRDPNWTIYNASTPKYSTCPPSPTGIKKRKRK